MSNALAISATTLTLQNLLTRATPNVTVSPLDQARNGNAGDQLNLFLYQTLHSAAWRNAEMPSTVRSGEVDQSPLALNLHYLITSYGENEAVSHQILGRAMSVLHDHMLLGAEEIRNATQITLPDSNLNEQLERIRITPLQHSLEDISKLWAGFQTQYRLSAAYEVAVILIESTRPKSSPLPVLRQGSEDRGPHAVASSSPTLSEISLPNGQPSAELGSLLTLLGQNLAGENLMVRFINPHIDPIDLTPNVESSGKLTVNLPDLNNDPIALSQWVAGSYLVSILVSPPSMPSWSSNEVPFGLAPIITVNPLNASAGNINLTITCRPRLRDEQRVKLLFGNQQVEAQNINTPADLTQPSTLTFQVQNVVAGEYVVRLRVDGVDSLPVIESGTPPLLEFDPNQKVTVT